MSQQVDLMRAEPAAIDEFLRDIEIDPDFPKFVQLCRAYGGRIVVVSDGLDRVVRTVMRASGWDLPFSANRLKWVGGDRWKLEFPHARKDCRSAMGNCKCSHGRRFPSSPAILVGDGRSDFCLAEHVHLVLAKGKLAGHCKENGLPYVQIHNFANATQVLRAWLDALGTTPAALACAAPSIIAGFEEGSP